MPLTAMCYPERSEGTRLSTRLRLLLASPPARGKMKGVSFILCRAAQRDDDYPINLSIEVIVKVMINPENSDHSKADYPRLFPLNLL